MGYIMKKFLLFFSISTILLLAGCATMPKDALTLTPEAFADRQMQTRKYETNDEKKILVTCTGLLQDMGFGIDESEIKVGLITGSKMRSAVDAGQQVAMIFVAALGGGVMPTDKDQKMRASVVTRTIGEKGDNVIVRVTFQRIVWNTQHQVTRSESLNDPKMYQEFFDKLSKAIFLEAQNI
jgi:hypothetical protein